MDKGREPLDIETYKMLVGYKGVDEQMICYVPTTNWCKHDTYFDGIKYTGPLGQNPLNRLMIEKHEKDTLAALEERLKQEEAEKEKLMGSYLKSVEKEDSPAGAPETKAESPTAENQDQENKN